MIGRLRRRAPGAPRAPWTPPAAGAALAALAVAVAATGCGAPARPGAAQTVGPPGMRASGAPFTGAPRNDERQLPVGFLGVNGEAVTGGEPGLWSDARFVGAVSALAPQAIRVFGGTPANFWDWRTGTFVRDAHVPPTLARLRRRIHVSLTDWARVVRAARAVPVYDLNLVTATLADQLAMLAAARRLGLPVTRVELGNELYSARYAWRFGSAADYVRVANRWTAALRAAFPRVQVALAGRDQPAPDPVGLAPAREAGWNQAVLAGRRGEDALTLHTYFRSGLGPGGSPGDPQSAQVMLAAALTRTQDTVAQTRRLPPGVQAWVTEFNLFDRGTRASATWAQGLDVALCVLGLALDPRVAQADAHALTASAPFGAIFPDAHGLDFGPAPGGIGARAAAFGSPARGPVPTAPWARSATGTALGTMLAVLDGADAVRGLTFTSTVSAPDRPVGAELSAAGTMRALLVNPLPRAVAVVLPPALVGRPFAERWGAPDLLVRGPTSLHHARGRGAGTLVLAPYSLTRLG